MGFVCPGCNQPGGLAIGKRMELPSDSRSDEITVQLIRCQSCDFRGVAIYEESRRGGLDDESIDHRGYKLDKAEWTRLNKLVAACPHPRDPKCGCKSHIQLGWRNEYGRWNRLEGFGLGGEFNMIIHR